MKDYKKEREQFEYEKRILEAILYFSRDDKCGMLLPTIEEFVLSEIVNGTIDYIAGEAGKVLYRQKAINPRASFEKDLYSYFEEKMQKSGDKIDEKIRNALLGMTKPKVVYVPEPSDNYIFCRLYHYYKGFAGSGGICNVISSSKHYLSHDVMQRVEFILPDAPAYDFEGLKYATPKLSSSEFESVKGIGKAMRKFVNKDIEYIKNHYFW